MPSVICSAPDRRRVRCARLVERQGPVGIVCGQGVGLPATESYAGSATGGCGRWVSARYAAQSFMSLRPVGPVRAAAADGRLVGVIGWRGPVMRPPRYVSRRETSDPAGWRRLSRTGCAPARRAVGTVRASRVASLCSCRPESRLFRTASALPCRPAEDPSSVISRLPVVPSGNSMTWRLVSSTTRCAPAARLPSGHPASGGRACVASLDSRMSSLTANAARPGT